MSIAQKFDVNEYESPSLNSSKSKHIVLKKNLHYINGVDKKFLYGSHKVYPIDNYNKNKDFIDNSFEVYRIKKLCNLLKSEDKGYHFRIHKSTNYILFGDIDGYNKPFTTFAEQFCQFMNEFYSINIFPEDISYTKNEKVNGSYHYSIPKYYCSTEKLREIHNNFVKLYRNEYTKDIKGKSNNVIDCGIYSEKWFRYPQQSKGLIKGTHHIIVKGKMKDFVVEHIPKNSICIEDNKFKCDEKSFNIKNRKIKRNISVKFNRDHKNFTLVPTSTIKKYLDIVNVERANDYNDWINMGMYIFNCNHTKDSFDLWDSWSQCCPSYCHNTCKYKWSTFKFYDVSIEKIKYLAKQDNKEKYEEIEYSFDDHPVSKGPHHCVTPYLASSPPAVVLLDHA